MELRTGPLSSPRPKRGQHTSPHRAHGTAGPRLPRPHCPLRAATGPGDCHSLRRATERFPTRPFGPRESRRNLGLGLCPHVTPEWSPCRTAQTTASIRFWFSRLFPVYNRKARWAQGPAALLSSTSTGRGRYSSKAQDTSGSLRRPAASCRATTPRWDRSSEECGCVTWLT